MYPYKVLEHLKIRSFVGRYVSITAVIALSIFAMLWLPWQQTVKGEGLVIPLDPMERNYKIVATIDGFIDDIYVVENQYVKKGDKLFSMMDVDTSYQSKLSAIMQEYQNTLKNTKNRALNLENNVKQQKQSMQMGTKVYDAKVVQIKNRLSAMKQQQKALENQYKIETTHYRRAKRLFKDGIESKRDVELKKFVMLRTEAKVKKMRIDIQNIYSDINITKQEKKRFINESELKLNQIQNTILDTQSTLNRLQQEIGKNSVVLSRYMGKDIMAKSDGHVMKVYQAFQNKFLKKGDEVMYFSPKVHQRAILLKVPIFNMPLIKKGLKVRIMFYGWPALQIAGWPAISHGTYGGVIQSIERTSYEKGTYYAIVTEDKDDTPWPKEENLRIGTEASLWVRLKTVPIWYELWRLMAAQPPKMLHLSEEKE